ncbi:hypothetical protein FA15DRAFT_676625, partial [Coprinopsis marcescibilis]
MFWRGSRFGVGQRVGLFPVRFHKEVRVADVGVGDEDGGHSVLSERGQRGWFFEVLAKTCEDVLDHEEHGQDGDRNGFIYKRTRFMGGETDHNGNGKYKDTGKDDEEEDEEDEDEEEDGEIERAAVTRINPRLTAHTVESMLWGAELGWTTLTANKTSVK